MLGQIADENWCNVCFPARANEGLQFPANRVIILALGFAGSSGGIAEQAAAERKWADLECPEFSGGMGYGKPAIISYRACV